MGTNHRVTIHTSARVTGTVNHTCADIVWLKIQSSVIRPMNSKSGAMLPIHRAKPENRCGQRILSGSTNA